MFKNIYQNLWKRIFLVKEKIKFKIDKLKFIEDVTFQPYKIYNYLFNLHLQCKGWIYL